MQRKQVSNREMNNNSNEQNKIDLYKTDNDPESALTDKAKIPISKDDPFSKRKSKTNSVTISSTDFKKQRFSDNSNKCILI